MTRTTVLVVQHVEVEGPARIRTAFEAAGAEVASVRVDRGHDVPADAGAYAALVVMGGPMSATSDDGFPTRQAELALLRSALDAGTPVLGVCLGAQLLALAAGGAIVPAPAPEIGWGAVELTAAAARDPLFAGLRTPVPVLHWHGETVELPGGAVLLASTPVCRNQAFRVGSRAWGLQFHVEVDHAAVEAFVDAFPADAAHAPGGADAIRAATAPALDDLEAAQRQLLRAFVSVTVAAPE